MSCPAPPSSIGRVLGQLRAAGTDLVWGTRCVACGEPGRSLCCACVQALEPPEPRVLADAVRDRVLGRLRVYAAGEYADTLAAAVPAFKERELRGLAVPLGASLATAVVRALVGPDLPVAAVAAACARVWLVPIPPTRRSRRERGLQPVQLLASRAARVLRTGGVDARVVVGTLGYVRAVADQSELGAADRSRNLRGALAARPGALTRALHRAGSRGEPVVLVDDIVTTGATLLEGRRALAHAGIAVNVAAVVADTPLRH